MLNVAFFQKVRCVFQISKSPKKISNHYPELKDLNFPPVTESNTFKVQAQDRNLEYFHFADLKNKLHFLKKSQL